MLVNSSHLDVQTQLCKIIRLPYYLNHQVLIDRYLTCTLHVVYYYLRLLPSTRCELMLYSCYCCTNLRVDVCRLLVCALYVLAYNCRQLHKRVTFLAESERLFI